jgi:spermidine synthase
MKIEINIPDGVSGDYKIETFHVKKDDFSQKISLFKTGRGVPEGTYKRLMRNGDVVMSNTPDEIRDFSYFLRQAHGSVLINGLGLGVLVQALIDKPEVKQITIIEKSQDVLNLVASHYEKSNKVTIIHADAFDYKPPKDVRYNAVWHDIWDFICADNPKEMGTLHRKYGRIADYQESWCKEECKRQKRTSWY